MGGSFTKLQGHIIFTGSDPPLIARRSSNPPNLMHYTIIYYTHAIYRNYISFFTAGFFSFPTNTREQWRPKSVVIFIFFHHKCIGHKIVHHHVVRIHCMSCRRVFIILYHIHDLWVYLTHLQFHRNYHLPWLIHIPKTDVISFQTNINLIFATGYIVIFYFCI